MSALTSFKEVLTTVNDMVVESACFKYEFAGLNHIHLAVVDCIDFFDAIMMTAAQTGGVWVVDYSIPVWNIDWPQRNIKPVPNAKEVAVAEFKALKRVVRDGQFAMDIEQLAACGTDSGKIESSLAHLLFNQGQSFWSPERGDSWGIIGQ